MGEKGNVGALVPEGQVAGLVERTTTTIVSTATGTGEQVIEAIRDEAVGAVAEQAVAEARDRLRSDPAKDEAAKDDAPNQNPPNDAP